MDLSQIDKFYFDLDQTLWNWNETILGAEDLIHTLQKSGRQAYFHTDNSLLSNSSHAKKLNKMDIKTEKESILTVNHVAAKFFQRKNIHSVYTIGEKDLIQELGKHDIENSQTADNVLLGLDRQFSYNKLQRAMKILQKGGDLYICSTEDKLRRGKKNAPHQKALNRALRTYTDNVKLLGKPSDEFVNAFSNYFGYLPENSLFVGDRLDDIEVGNKLGMKTALVMSGKTSKNDLKDIKSIRSPDFGVSNLSKLSARIN